MLTDKQRAFLETYILNGATLSADHAEAARLLDQVTSEARAEWTKAAAALRKDVLEDLGDLSIAQKKALVSAVEAAISPLAADYGNAKDLIEGFKGPRALKVLITSRTVPLKTALAKVAAPVPDALSEEAARLAAAVKGATEAVEGLVSDSTAKAAKTMVDGLASLHASVTETVASRAAALKGIPAEQLETAAKALGGVDKLNAVMTQVGPGAAALLDGKGIKPADLAEVLNGCLGGNPGALAALYQSGCNRDPVKLAALATAFPDVETQGYNPRANLKSLLANGGLDACPDALGQIMSVGCMGDPAALETFCKAFKDPTDQKNLKELLEEGGLAGAPAALGHVAAMTNGADQIKGLSVAFDDPAKRDKLSNLVLRGGLGGPEARSPDALASILRDGVTNPKDLIEIHDAFGPAGMGDMASMISAFHIAEPPPSDAGVQFKYVATRVGTPASKLKTQFFDRIDGQAAMTTGRAAVLGPASNPEVRSAAAALGPTPTAEASAGLAAAIATAGVLGALEGVAGVDPSHKTLLEAGLTALGAATRVRTETDALAADPAAAKAAAEAAIRKALDGTDPTAEAIQKATTTADTEATQAAEAVRLAAEALTKAVPPTKLLVDDALAKAQEALAKARLAVDDLVRATAIAQAQAGFEAIRLANDTAAKAAMSSIQTEAQTGAVNRSRTANVALKDSAEKGGALKLAQDKVDQANASGNPAATSPAYATLVSARDAARTAYATARTGARATHLTTLDAASTKTTEAIVSKAVLENPALQQARAEAARLAALASLPGATPADKLAAADAEAVATDKLADVLQTPALQKSGALKAPGADSTTIASAAGGTVVTSTAADLLDAALSLKAALAAAVSLQDTLSEAWQLQARLTRDAADTAKRTGATQSELDAATDAAEALKKVGTRITAAQTRADSLASAAGAIDKSLSKCIKVERTVRKQLTNGTTEAQDCDLRIQALLDAVSLIKTTVKRLAAAGYPAMNQQQLIAVAATMKKLPMTGLSEKDTCIPGAESDLLHFCGRHSREHFGFDGRDLFGEDAMMDATILEAQMEGIGASGRTDAQKEAVRSASQIKTTSLWPAGFGATEVRACLALAVAEMEKRMKADTTPGTSFTYTNVRKYIDLPKARRAPDDTIYKDIMINYMGVDFTTKIGISPGSGTDDYEIGQFYPSSTPSVPFFDMHAIKSALGV